MKYVTVEHDVVRNMDGETVGVIESTWDSAIPGEFTLDGYPAGSCLRGARAYGDVPRGVLDLFCGIYGERAAAVRGMFTFRPRRAG